MNNFLSTMLKGLGATKGHISEESLGKLEQESVLKRTKEVFAFIFQFVAKRICYAINAIKVRTTSTLFMRHVVQSTIKNICLTEKNDMNFSSVLSAINNFLSENRKKLSLFFYLTSGMALRWYSDVKRSFGKKKAF